MATIKDVAKRANVSTTTVSHVINKTRFVAEETRNAVWAAIKELHYSPSAVARSLKVNHTKSIGLLATSSEAAYFAEIIESVEKSCFQKGYTLILGNAWNDLYAGAINFMFVDLTAARGQVVAGKARPLAISLSERSPLYPAVPALTETFPGFVTSGFLAIAVPKATPRPVQERLNALINEALTSPEIKNRLANEFALRSRPLTLEQCAQQDRDERAKWGEYVKIARIEPQ